MLEQTGIARHERGRGKAKHLPKREIPRHDAQHRTERQIGHIAASRVAVDELFRQKRLSVDGIIVAGQRRFFDFRPGFTGDFAHFQGDDRRVFVALAAQTCGDAAEYFRALLKGGRRPTALGAANTFQDRR